MGEVFGGCSHLANLALVCLTAPLLDLVMGLSLALLAILSESDSPKQVSLVTCIVVRVSIH